MKIENYKLKDDRGGFTLVELLIVVAIIGILVTGVFVATNPIEQTNKARDGSALGKARELANACERYYAGTGVYPADCAALETAGELRTPFCTPNIGTGKWQFTFTASTCAVSFTPQSTFYKQTTRCGTTCDIPGDTL